MIALTHGWKHIKVERKWHMQNPFNGLFIVYNTHPLWNFLFCESLYQLLVSNFEFSSNLYNNISKLQNMSCMYIYKVYSSTWMYSKLQLWTFANGVPSRIDPILIAKIMANDNSCKVVQTHGWNVYKKFHNERWLLVIVYLLHSSDIFPIYSNIRVLYVFLGIFKNTWKYLIQRPIFKPLYNYNVF
jgi:hypothetical protein